MNGAELTALENCPAPAKLNLFLHITGRRADGYHLLQTLFRLIDFGDTLDFRLREDGKIHRLGEITELPAEQDLSVRAARLLQQSTGVQAGADIRLRKHIPLGGGLGGGSSDAATTLIALNRLWNCGLSRSALQQLALQLGADVPFFIFGRDAFAEGVGEVLQAVELEKTHYLVVFPNVHTSTEGIFSTKELTRDSSPIKIADLAATLNQTRNDLQSVACVMHPEIGQCLDWLNQYAPAQMTGSGACVFAAFATGSEVERVAAECPNKWRAWRADSISRHPLYDWVPKC